MLTWQIPSVKHFPVNREEFLRIPTVGLRAETAGDGLRTARGSVKEGKETIMRKFTQRGIGGGGMLLQVSGWHGEPRRPASCSARVGAGGRGQRNRANH